MMNEFTQDELIEVLYCMHVVNADPDIQLDCYSSITLKLHQVLEDKYDCYIVMSVDGDEPTSSNAAPDDKLAIMKREAKLLSLAHKEEEKAIASHHIVSII